MSTHNGLELTPLYMMPRHIKTKDGALYTLEDGTKVNIPQKIIDISRKRQELYREQKRQK